MTSSARRRVRICSRRSASRTSSMKWRLRVNALPPTEERRLALGLDALDQRVVVVFHVAWVVRRPDAGDRHHGRTVVGGREHGRPAERVSDEQADFAARVVHELHRAHGVGDLVGERPVAPVALGVAETEVVEAQHADALAGELLADPAGGRAVLAEREAVRENAPSAHLALGDVDTSRQRWPGGARELDTLGHRLTDQLRVERRRPSGGCRRASRPRCRRRARASSVASSHDAAHRLLGLHERRLPADQLADVAAPLLDADGLARRPS